MGLVSFFDRKFREVIHQINIIIRRRLRYRNIYQDFNIEKYYGRA